MTGVLGTHSGNVPRALPGGRFHVQDTATPSRCAQLLKEWSGYISCFISLSSWPCELGKVVTLVSFYWWRQRYKDIKTTQPVSTKERTWIKVFGIDLSSASPIQKLCPLASLWHAYTCHTICLSYFWFRKHRHLTKRWDFDIIRKLPNFVVPFWFLAVFSSDNVLLCRFLFSFSIESCRKTVKLRDCHSFWVWKLHVRYTQTRRPCQYYPHLLKNSSSVRTLFLFQCFPIHTLPMSFMIDQITYNKGTKNKQ